VKFYCRLDDVIKGKQVNKWECTYGFIYMRIGGGNHMSDFIALSVAELNEIYLKLQEEYVDRWKFQSYYDA